MKGLRRFTSFLMLFTWVLHTLSAYGSSPVVSTLPVLVVGIFYFTIGLLMIMNNEFSCVWGIILPIIGIGTGFFVIGFQHWNTMFSILFTIDAAILICCTVLLFNEKIHSHE